MTVSNSKMLFETNEARLLHSDRAFCFTKRKLTLLLLINRQTITVLNQALTETVRHFFAGRPVSRAYLFSSVARGNATERSDLDVLVEQDKEATLFDHARMSWQLEDLLQHRVDVVTEGSLSPYIRPFIERDRILIYER